MSLFMSLQVLNHKKKSFVKDDIIITEGKPGAKVYVLIKGEVSISIEGQELARTCTPGDLFGEIASIRGCNNGATVSSTQDSEFFVIDNFISYLKQNPDDSIHVMRVLCDRISNMNKKASDS